MDNCQIRWEPRMIQTFKEYLNEKKGGTMEIPTTKAKEFKKELEKAGHQVTKADDEGLVVKTDDMEKLHKWMLKNGWDKQDIKDMHS